MHINKNKNTEKKTKKTYLLVGGAIILVAAASCGGLVLYKHMKDGQKAKEDINTAEFYNKSEENVAPIANDDGGSATGNNTETTEGNDAKTLTEASEAARQNVEKNTAGLKIAKPIVSFAGYGGDANGINKNQVVVGGYISNIQDSEESGGKCTFVFTKGAQTVTEIGGILPSAKTTTCASLTMNSSRFSSGTWKVKIQYKSKYAEGESETFEFTL